MRPVLLATELDTATSRSPVPDVIVMNTAALAVPPTVSRVHTSLTSTSAGDGPQDNSGNSRNRARATRRTTVSFEHSPARGFMERPGPSVYRTFNGSKRPGAADPMAGRTRAALV